MKPCEEEKEEDESIPEMEECDKEQIVQLEGFTDGFAGDF
jgi:hypothetical protein